MDYPLEIHKTLIPLASKEFIDATKGMFIIDHTAVVNSSYDPPKMHIPVSDVDAVDFTIKEHRRTCKTVCVHGDNRNILKLVRKLNIPYKMYALVAPRVPKGNGYIVNELNIAVYSREDAELVSKSLYEKYGVRIFGYIENTDKTIHIHDDRITSGKLRIGDGLFHNSNNNMKHPYIKCLHHTSDTLHDKIHMVNSLLGNEFTTFIAFQGKKFYEHFICKDLNEFESVTRSMEQINYTAVCIQLDDSMSIDGINLAVNKLKLAGLFNYIHDHKEVVSPFVLDIQL